MVAGISFTEISEEKILLMKLLTWLQAQMYGV